MKRYAKKPFPLEKIRRFLEPGPVVLVTSAHKGERDVMTMGWHMMMGFAPALIGCFICDQNYSFLLVRKGRQCVINVPTYDLLDAVVGIGNCSGRDEDKFEKFGLTAVDGEKVDAPLIAECYASFECRLVDSSWATKRNLFVFEAVAAHVATSPKYPKTIHYRGDAKFMVAGPTVTHRRGFRPGNL